MKVQIELEVPDDFEPFTMGCENDCPFAYEVGMHHGKPQYTCGYENALCPMERMKEVKNEVI